MRVSVAIVARASAMRMSLQFWLHKAAVQIIGVDFSRCSGERFKRLDVLSKWIRAFWSMPVFFQMDNTGETRVPIDAAETV